ncbi:amino acid adenylation domain-containing protein [Pseudomonas lactucae]|uniref:Non-ribosomal peptide synthetase n=1 Tax=Pseudomonas lactucae TaxID=2813360 RepID=A0A9X0Y9I5_9PSED|nr:amino acid adenylation domain-containing protein [Pseudomonas lactucae]MBN2975069.1 non-ribosomal peptide synthetase [Pseudomonas lactucae]
MRHLDIVLCGRSHALACLTQELEQMGHTAHLLTSDNAIDLCRLPVPDLLIDDASTAQLPHYPSCQRLSLRAHSDNASDVFAPVRVDCLWRPGDGDWMLLGRLEVCADAAGNGADLAHEAVAQVVEMASMHIGRFSRSADYLEVPREPVRALDRLSSLTLIDSLVWCHHHNATVNTGILEDAKRPFIQRLADSLLINAERNALKVQGRGMSYAQLHAYSVAIQERLQPLLEISTGGVTVVAISLPKGTALYAAILAVLGCGAVYLPLDPNHPVERRTAILKHSGACLLIQDTQADDPLPGLATLDISHLDFFHHGAQGYSRVALAPDQRLLRVALSGSAPCVAIYTSGTTGQPKGVLLTVDNLSHFCAWYALYVELSHDSRALQFSTINFDASLLDIFPTLIQGGELIVPTEDQRRDPVALAELIQQEQVTHAFLPPALLSIIQLKSLYGIQHLVTGGDVCEPQVIEQLVGHCALHNIYGPTETTVLATCRTFQPADNNRNLGVPIANTSVYLLDEHGQPVGEADSGEIHIAGRVGAGYLGALEMTAERYRLHELPDGQRVRLYRTGDLARWTREGIQIIGRLDNQVKIRGFRVEPEEIEHLLQSSQLFRQLAVVIDNQRRILAFFSQPQNAEGQVASEKLQAYALKHLPDYMRPSAYCLLERLPATANGKIDRKALRDLPVNYKTQGPHLAPQNITQQQLLELWSRLLDLPAEDISVDDSFFNLGGHSILLSQMLMGIRETFSKGVSINRFIEQPTLINLANLIDQHVDATATVSPQALQDAMIRPELDVLPISRLGNIHKVIVTGSNGFLGVHIVEALLELGSTEVACLVRESAGMSAQQRFEQALIQNRLEHLDLSRVKVLAADISKPRLGLSEQDYEWLDREYGVLIYNAANVNHVLDYESLVKDNVTPVLECLQLCEGRSKKIFNFISTLSASSTVDEQGRVLEEPPAFTPPIYIRNGYNLSKWVAERILWNASESGVWVNLYRPGNIAFNTRTGVCQPHQNRLMLMLKGSLQLKEVPELALNFDLMPVDFLARFIAFHASRHNRSKAVFNLHNPQPLSWTHYVEAFRAAGHDFQMVPVTQWQQRLSAIDSNNALFGVVGFYLNGFEEDIGDISMIEYRNALSGIQSMGEDYPAKSSALLQKGCDYLKQIDFI